MPQLTDLIGFLDRLLETSAFRDYGPNGVQVPGRTEVQTIVTGVSAHAELFDRAAAEGADLVLVHHGLFWKGGALEITPALHRRLKILFAHDMALAAYHLPLDGHPEHGNNALIAEGLGATDRAPFAFHEGRAIGVRAAFAGDGIALDELVARVRELVGGREPVVIPAGPDRVRTLGIVSGGGTDFLGDAIELRLDAFLTGEPLERAFGAANDDDITFIAAGHHATETFGVRRLGDLLAGEFGVRHVFVDVPNPI